PTKAIPNFLLLLSLFCEAKVDKLELLRIVSPMLHDKPPIKLLRFKENFSSLYSISAFFIIVFYQTSFTDVFNESITYWATEWLGSLDLIRSFKFWSQSIKASFSVAPRP